MFVLEDRHEIVLGEFRTEPPADGPTDGRIVNPAFVLVVDRPTGRRFDVGQHFQNSHLLIGERRHTQPSDIHLRLLSGSLDDRIGHGLGVVDQNDIECVPQRRDRLTCVPIGSVGDSRERLVGDGLGVDLRRGHTILEDLHELVIMVLLEFDILCGPDPGVHAMFEVTDDPVAVVRGEQQAEVVDLIEVSQNVVFDEFVSLVEKKDRLSSQMAIVTSAIIMASSTNQAVESIERPTGVSRWNYLRIGGLAALAEAAIYVAGIAYFLVILDFASVTGALQEVELFVANETSLYAMYLLIYVIFGIVLVALVLALHEHLKADAPILMRATTAFGLIWAGLVIASGMIASLATGVVVDLYSTDPTQATTVWLAVSPVIDGLGGGNEIIGGLWTLLVSVAALRARALHRLVNYFGLVVGTAGILSAIPALGEIGGGIFGLTQIVWFVALGVLLLGAGRREASAYLREE